MDKSLGEDEGGRTGGGRTGGGRAATQSSKSLTNVIAPGRRNLEKTTMG